MNSRISKQIRKLALATYERVKGTGLSYKQYLKKLKKQYSSKR